MFNVGKLELSLDSVARSKTILVNSVSPVYAYVDGKRSDNLQGYAYESVCHRNGFQSLRIKVEGETKPSITAEMLEAAGGAIECDVNGFVGRIYVDTSGRANLSAKAASVVPAKKS